LCEAVEQIWTESVSIGQLTETQNHSNRLAQQPHDPSKSQSQLSVCEYFHHWLLMTQRPAQAKSNLLVKL